MAERCPRRAAMLVAVALSVLGLGAPTAIAPSPIVVYNASASAPLGFYRPLSDGPLKRGDLVLAWLPDPARWLAAERDYLPATVPLVKRIAALAGDIVCADSGIVVINDRVAAKTLLIDSEGRPLPAWHGCRSLQPDEVFLLMEGVPASFDGRYFGPIRRSAIIEKLAPLWTW